MKTPCILLVLSFLLSLWHFEARACTAVIISGKITSDGRPLMWKNRDTDHLDNSIRHFKGEKYAFTGLVNSESEGGEVWIGANTAGFSIMNTASYCLKNDDVPADMMDREGRLMYRALEICATLEDFENFLDTLGRPMGVEANFGCIDAFGGAAWYETGNFSYVRFDVNAAEEGFRVVTNFSETGDEFRWKGVERYETACAVFRGMNDRGSLAVAGPLGIIDSLSRSYRHEVMGIDLVRDSREFLSRTKGVVPDQDFIPRRSTSAAVAVHGVPAGGDPAETVLWAALGYPAVAVTVPVPVSEEDHIPLELSSFPVSSENTFCGLAGILKRRLVFHFPEISNYSEYADLNFVLDNGNSGTSTLACCRRAEAAIKEKFLPVYREFRDGKLDEEEYLKRYDSISREFFPIYEKAFELIAELRKNH